MPYWGHDLDWGYRVRQAGWTLAVDHDVEVGHTYIRNSKPHPATVRRRKLRILSDEPTRRTLAQEYGPDWRNVLEYR
jgi:GT2 family glycosyltransferase